MWRSLFRSCNSILSRGKLARREERRQRPLRFQRLESRTLLSINGDFNGDGYDDLAVGAINEDIDGFVNAGAVSIVYGSRRGLSATNNQFWHQNSPGIDGVPTDGENFGFSLAVGDFNGDGFSDLAIGVLNDTVGSVQDAGAVNVIYGSSTGLRATGDQLWTRNSPGIAGSAGVAHRFGFSLAAGDFNGDGRDDLAIGVTGEDVGATGDSGAVQVILGSAAGLTNVGDQYFTQNSSGINDSAEDNDNFGTALAAGDFNNDGRDDLAIGVQFENLGAIAGAGAVNVLYGGAAGLTGSGDQFWSQDSSGINESAEANDEFGKALAAGDFNGDGRDDLAIGVKNESVGAVEDAGAVHVIFGTNSGLASTGDQFWTQDSTNIADFAEGGDFFGSSLAAGDFDGDGRFDLAIGVSNEDGPAANSGAVHLLYGSTNGLTSIGNLFWTQDTLNGPGGAEMGDNFGDALAAGDYDGDGRADIAIGVPGEDNLTGIVHILYDFRFVDPLITFWSQDLLSSSDGSEGIDTFGIKLG